eukprot:GILJ01004962.1.p1 GENE.GILJ01004962.1~~GILJ01004962.1.p1  ORF type:complete len:267 (+),score=45.51 GILJ01004962.1:47-847(+)
MASTSELCRQQGNLYFSKGKYDAAIEAYTEAITHNNKNVSLYTNRALCHMKKHSWGLVKCDCLTALHLESNNIKANYMLGLALETENDLPEALNKLRKAKEACSYQDSVKKTYAMEIHRAFLQCRRKLWEYEQTERMHKRADLKRFLSELLSLNKLRNVLPEVEYVRRLAEVEELFGEDLTAAKRRQVPDHLCCKISMDLMEDPVCTPSGITYDRKYILQHLSKVGSFDPVTRHSLSASQLVPNLAIKQAIEAFVEEHPWAFESVE